MVVIGNEKGMVLKMRTERGREKRREERKGVSGWVRCPFTNLEVELKGERNGGHGFI